MFIKQIIIQGFKSYKEQTVIEPFSPKHNVIVGRNGSGKSNFFGAIQFALGDRYNNMGREERGALLHEGTGSAVMSAYVEVIFDNSDERFPTGTKEVILRRTIGQKKDEYSLNRKNTTRSEIQNMLESAGFSRSNPYYIVAQGRVTAITNMKDAERLDMLKDVAGTKVYDERRAESRRIMTDTTQKREKIDETLEHIRGRLHELEEEKEELKAFQEKDRERRCLEYTIHHKDQEALQEAMDKLNEDREGGMERTDENRELLQQSDAEVEEIDNEIAELQQQLKVLGEEKAQLEEEHKETARERAKIELDVQSMTDNQSAAQQARTQHATDLKAVQDQIKQREAELKQVTPQYAAKREEEKTLRQQMQDAEATSQRLYAKQGRQSQFKSKRDRDAWLQKEINDVNMVLAKRKAVVIQTAEDIAELEATIEKAETDIVDARSRIDNRGDEQQNISAEVQRAKDEHHQLLDQRKELWRDEGKVDSKMLEVGTQLERAESELYKTMDQSTSRGLQFVRKIVKQHNIEGAHGALGELFTFSDKYKTAVEVTAGTSLFNYVVENDEVATRITEILKKEKGGRITFIPLQQLKDKPPANIPKASDAVHLISKLKYRPEYEKAFQQVFGKTIVCPNLQVAAQYARSHGVSAITPEGDRSDKKGALTGGWHDVRSSRHDAMRKESSARAELEGCMEKKKEIQAELDRLGQQVTKVLSELQRIEQRRVQMESGYGPQREDLRRNQDAVNRRRDELKRKQKQRDTLEGLVRDLGEQLSGYQTELAGDFKKALSNEEERQLESLMTRLPELRKHFAELSGERAELEARKGTIELELREHLRLRLDQLQSADVEAGASREGSSTTRLNERKKDLKRITAALDSLTKNLNENESSIDTAQANLQNTTKQREDKQNEVEKLRRDIRTHQKTLEKAASKRAVLSSRLADVGAQIRGLGVLPDAAFSAQYTNMAANTATTRLHKVQDALKKYGHVNKKAFEQYVQFEKQREVLEERRKELHSSHSSIQELIDHLDQKKDEAIERTFRQVSREFATVFERLVPAGKGRLIIQRRTDKAQAPPAEDSGDENEAAQRPGGGVENYTGVGISVSFNSKHDDQQRIQQLSGGQKSLCALALIFAIQAADPAPFYLFDEIDANLDSQYRTAVADLLKVSAERGQFICTTFRPEMLLVAEKCYGVSYGQKTSAIDVVSREQALDFVEGQSGGK
ncbi:Structural maintenance of chromosomes protein 3 [Vermiconidia calcicola]|uniref:Structural maintenance of chromosomes protein 3 n=1 Tax=Vermiconidia calcicola TaxID=1690605 RepID=A0ACC3NIS7_9PEZI|nr:Structural maintenance of chromosomes protein 3 [Vermiconidia calcicola]